MIMFKSKTTWFKDLRQDMHCKGTQDESETTCLQDASC